MELSRSRGCGGQGVKPTHDFLSLYSPVQPDLTSTIPGGYLKTHDFLQPLEQVGKEGVYIEKSKSLPPSPPTMMEHILPRGMGTYSISHISYINQIQCQKVPKPERGNVISAAQSSSSNNNDENSNCSSYTGSGFTLWEESNVNKGKTRKENNITGSMHTREDAKKIGVPSQSSFIYNHPSTTTFSYLSCSRPSSAPINRYFVDTVKFGKNVHEEEDYDEEFVIKKEPSFHHKGSISVKIDTTKHDQKSNSPRSKHSATEQRRRSKINDRFSVLREIIPRGDQKRDKASLLLEVIEYIQFLQEKVHKYEDSPQLPNNTSTIPTNTQNLLDSNISQQPQSTNNPSPCATDTETTASQGVHQLSYSKSCIRDEIVASYKLKDEEAIIESGTISISTIYSQGLSSALTQALKSSGVDLSHANISIQIDLGKRSNTHTFTSPPLDLKENETPIDQTVARSRLASTWEEESGEGFKRLKPNRK